MEQLPKHEELAQPNTAYDMWAEAMKDVEFQGGKPKLKKVGERRGSNDGGWYEDENTGERMYVKFYENPDQGKVEFIANAIYKKLGIKVPETRLINIDGREGVASLEISGATKTSAESQKESQDVQNGFVADAYLANWDVIGAANDNIFKGADGGFYRVDNGGTMIFRARGGDKEFDFDIPELNSMRRPWRPAGEIFHKITYGQILEQAQHLIDNLSQEDIEAIIKESGLEGETCDAVRRGLIGRRNYLRNMCLQRERLLETMKEIPPIRQKGEVICENDCIEDQRISIIDKSDKGVTEFSFKLNTPTEEISNLIKKLEDAPKDAVLEMPDGAILRRGEIVYEGFESDKRFVLSRASIIEKNGARILIASPTLHYGLQIRAAERLVNIEIPAEKDPDTAWEIFSDLLKNYLGIQGLLETAEEPSKEYKEERFKWQYKIDGELSPEQLEAAARLKRKEVFPGYSTLIEEGKHKEYLKKYGKDLRAVHFLRDDDPRTLKQILTNGLMSTSERFSRGLIVEGVSSQVDLRRGGGDSVFTRVTSVGARHKVNDIEQSNTVIIFKPEIFDRTDWYSYDTDKYGSTDEKDFKERLTPDELFSKVAQAKNEMPQNEQMFKTGIGVEYIEKIEMDPDRREELIDVLKESGLTEVNGKPIEEFIVAREMSLFDLRDKREFDAAMAAEGQETKKHPLMELLKKFARIAMRKKN